MKVSYRYFQTRNCKKSILRSGDKRIFDKVMPLKDAGSIASSEHHD